MSLPDRMERKIRRTDAGCWEWTGSMAHGGYGSIGIGSRTDGSRRTTSTHRYAYELLVGPIPDGLDIDHLCRNRACCNPDHLEPVTRSENLRRGRSAEVRRQQAALITHCPHGHEYTPENTRLVTTKTGVARHCRACNRVRSLAHYYAKKAARAA